MNRTFLFPLITLITAPLIAACDPKSCDEQTKFRISHETGGCYDVTINDRKDEFNFSSAVCSTQEHEVAPSTFDFTVSRGGTQLQSGTKTVACGDTVSITLNSTEPGTGTTPPPPPATESVKGTPYIPGDGYIYCTVGNPRSVPGTLYEARYAWVCNNQVSNVANIPCSGVCVFAPNETKTGGAIADPCFFNGGGYSMQCWGHFRY